jgi:hypothetical protein
MNPYLNYMRAKYANLLQAMDLDRLGEGIVGLKEGLAGLPHGITGIRQGLMGQSQSARAMRYAEDNASNLSYAPLPDHDQKSASDEDPTPFNSVTGVGAAAGAALGGIGGHHLGGGIDHEVNVAKYHFANMQPGRLKSLGNLAHMATTAHTPGPGAMKTMAGR